MTIDTGMGTDKPKLTPQAIAVGIALIIVLIIGGWLFLRVALRPSAPQQYVNCLNSAVANGTDQNACGSPP